MSVIRSVGKAIGEIILIFSLGGLIVAIWLVQTTEYENMKAIFSEVLEAQITFGERAVGEGIKGTTEREEQLERLYQTILQMCENKDKVEISITESGQPVAIDCEEIRTAAQSEGGDIGSIIADVASRAIFDDVYYKKYDCEFIECVQTGQLGIVVSAQGHEFFKQIRMYAIAGAAVGAVLIFVSAESWYDRMRGFGLPLVFIGLSYVVLSLAKSILISQFPAVEQAEQAGISLMPIVDKILAPMMNSFLIALILGAALTVGGYVFAHEKRKSKTKTKKK